MQYRTFLSIGMYLTKSTSCCLNAKLLLKQVFIQILQLIWVSSFLSVFLVLSIHIENLAVVLLSLDYILISPEQFWNMHF